MKILSDIIICIIKYIDLIKYIYSSLMIIFIMILQMIVISKFSIALNT